MPNGPWPLPALAKALAGLPRGWQPGAAPMGWWLFEVFETFLSHATRAMHQASRGGRMLLARSPLLLDRPPSIVPLQRLLSKPN